MFTGGEYLEITGVNPEPWAIGTANAGRRGGQIKASMSPNHKMQTYQNALAEEIKYQLADRKVEFTGYVSIRFWFWREVELGRTPSGATRVGNYADTTNLQKSTEDALQKIFFANDSAVLDNHSTIVEQGPLVQPFIAMFIKPWFDEPTDWMTHLVGESRKKKLLEDPIRDAIAEVWNG